MWDNPWFVGIVGGIISGLLVYFITNIIVNKVSRKEYFKKVEEANREIIVMLIMSVTEERIPSIPVIKSLIKSIARSYGIKEEHINDIEKTLEDLIKEIFETKFISNDKKNEISESLIELIEENKKFGMKTEELDQRVSMIDTYSYALTISVVILSLLMAVLVVIDPTTNEADSLSERFMLPFAVGATISISINLVSTFRKTKNTKKQQENIRGKIIQMINKQTNL